MMRNLKSEIRNLNCGSWIVLGIVAVLLSGVWLVLARGSAIQTGPARISDAQGREVGGGGGVGVRFGAVDVYVDTGAKKLGAYQVEVVAKHATVVGVEGGESKAFNEAPYYDPAALQGGKIVVAAFSTDDTLPNGLTRVARLHFMMDGVPEAPVAGKAEAGAGAGMPEMTSKLVVATDADGKNVEAKLLFRPYSGDKQ